MSLSEGASRRLEETMMRAWPAFEQEDYDGWYLRFADGFTKRANSVNAFHPSTLELAEKTAHCEAAYRDKGLPIIFRMTPYSCPDELDSFLEQRGYVSMDRTAVMVGSVIQNVRETASRFMIRSALLTEWLGFYASLREPSVETLAALRGIVSRIPTSVFPVVASVGGTPIGYGLGVVDGEWLGIFSLFVDPISRREGLGKALLVRILRWAGEHGATRAYLQVEEDNRPALDLYENLGFEVAYPYWYRVKSSQPISQQS